MTTYHFTGPSTTRKHVGKCPVCGKRVTRSRTFDMTVNPFNRNGDGTVRTWEQVDERLQAQANAWVPDFTHGACRGADLDENLSETSPESHHDLV